VGPKRGGHGGPPIQVVTTGALYVASPTGRYYGALYVASPTGRYYGGVIRCKCAFNHTAFAVVCIALLANPPRFGLDSFR